MVGGVEEKWDVGRQLRDEQEGGGRGSPGSIKGKPSSGNGELGSLPHGKKALS